jgi:hypothetical protein
MLFLIARDSPYAKASVIAIGPKFRLLFGAANERTASTSPLSDVAGRAAARHP